VTASIGSGWLAAAAFAASIELLQLGIDRVGKAPDATEIDRDERVQLTAREVHAFQFQVAQRPLGV
jgi:hypothetical protein